MRIISYNLNGIRSAINKGFIEWLKTGPADVVCVQETKAAKDNVDHRLFNDIGYEDYWFSAQKKGYSGVAVFSRIKPTHIEYGTGHKVSDDEGRVIQLDFGDTRLVNAYFPSGTTGDERQQFKYMWLDEFNTYLDNLKKTYPRLIVCGDYNIAHKEIDIHNPKSNKKTTGFLPEERAWFDRFLDNGYVDSFRYLNKEPHHYTWWSVMRPSTRLENKGWRIDYICVTENLQKKIKAVNIFPEIRHSDHCPSFLELN